MVPSTGKIAVSAEAAAFHAGEAKCASSLRVVNLIILSDSISLSIPRLCGTQVIDEKIADKKQPYFIHHALK
jgi:hypothetical protein